MKEQKASWPGWTTGRQIGRGGYGTVYEIWREEYGVREKAALKVISIPQDQQEIEELRLAGMDEESITTQMGQRAQDIVREYRMMMGLKNCPNIVHCEDLQVDRQGLGYHISMKMELLVPLIQAMEQGAEDCEGQIIRLGLDLCHALEVCREQKILHRDVKPQNIFLAPDGSFKLGDFGIARVADKNAGGTVGVGTYSFMAPEVLMGSGYDSRADLYSLGLVLYWLLNHCRGPFLSAGAMMAEDQEQARLLRFGGTPLPPPAKGSRGLKAVVLKACAYQPDQRYQSPREMARALEQLSPGEKISGSWKKWLLAAGAAALLAGGLLLLPREQDTSASVATAAQTEPVVKATVPGEVTFREPFMEKLVRYKLNRPVGAITEEECRRIRELPWHDFYNVINGSGRDGLYLHSLEDLAYFPNLTAIALQEERYLTDLSPLAGCQALSAVSLRECTLDNVDVLAQLPKLRDVDLSYSTIGDLSALTSVHTLAYLQVSYAYGDSREVQDAPLGQEQLVDDILRANPGLSTLGLCAKQLKDPQVLTELTNLQDLYYYGAVGKDCSFLSQMTQLYSLQVFYDNYGEDIYETTLEDLSFLENLTGLTYLTLARVDDPAQLEYLWNLTNLNSLDFFNSRVTQDQQAMDTLRAALPGCRIEVWN